MSGNGQSRVSTVRIISKAIEINDRSAAIGSPQASVDAVVDDQHATLLFLRSSAAFAPGGGAREIETHAANIFLIGDRAWKLKRAVQFGYLDFTTPARRGEALSTELRLNRRTASELYLAVHTITRSETGKLAIDGIGETIDWLLEMKRFPDDALFAEMADRGNISADIVVRLADHVIAFHDEATICAGQGAKSRFLTVVEGNAASLAAFPDVFPALTVTILCDSHRAALQTLGHIIEDRGISGRVRHGHGDLHLANVAMVGGEPTMFDCLEFNQALATIDVLYDVAFLIMDLWHRGLKTEANTVFNRYLDRSPIDEGGVALLPLFISVRATIRAHVMAAQVSRIGAVPELAIAARAYLDLAITMMMPIKPRVVAIGGFSGTGKTSVARLIAGDIGRVPGARVVRSDVVRKQLAGVPLETRLDVVEYTPTNTQWVYAAVEEATTNMLVGGQSVVADAVFADLLEREAIARVARCAGLQFQGIWLVASDQTRLSRVSARTGDASDAGPDVALQQTLIDPGALDNWITLCADGFLPVVVDAASQLCDPTRVSDNQTRTERSKARLPGRIDANVNCLHNRVERETPAK